jgi:hypothetical protein
VWSDRSSVVTSTASNISAEVVGSGSIPMMGTSTTAHSLVVRRAGEVSDSHFDLMILICVSLQSTYLVLFRHFLNF